MLLKTDELINDIKSHNRRFIEITVDGAEVRTVVFQDKPDHPSVLCLHLHSESDDGQTLNPDALADHLTAVGLDPIIVDDEPPA